MNIYYFILVAAGMFQALQIKAEIVRNREYLLTKILVRPPDQGAWGKWVALATMLVVGFLYWAITSLLLAALFGGIVMLTRDLWNRW